LVEWATAVSNGNHEVINRFIVRDIQVISASLNQDLSNQPRGSFVAIHEPMICNHAFQQSGSLSVDPQMISRIRAPKGGLDQVQTAYAGTPSVAKRLVMRRNRIGKRNPVVPPTD
jgi:hypothetical protein